MSCNNNINNSNTHNKIQNTNSQEHQNYLIKSWTSFDFTNLSAIKNPDYGEQKFVDYINLFPKHSTNEITESIEYILAKSSSNKDVLNHFLQLFDKYLYDVNSPFYNEDYYKIVLHSIIESSSISANDKVKYNIRYKIALRNNIGSKAENFNFYVENDLTNLYALNDKDIILFFYTPGCNSCATSINALRSSSQLTQNINILAIYPDGDYNIWMDYKDQIPKQWINGIDKNKEILQNQLYDLKASPTIYLLDKDKKVVLKDISVEVLLKYISHKQTKRY
ncbi:DUF5106 domain-containing protein [Sphingobacterium bovistauri]|uniref:DUF5106 domain-containing protein n=1 Tax=Sphingobacterium bovistauri TaxID=2781959 RepID=A0ABS7Z5I2_9SPHI|nr:DUF5106 domain-containing protein [Sphingobacterium bovistauri]MCA5004135.1 DUF5106 domain-containing protein [Sphingobacterium bovistauri]